MAAVALSACSWPQFRGDGLRSGVASTEHEISAARLGDLQIAWSSSGRNLQTEPLVRGGIVVVEGAFTIFGLDARTGAERWRRPDLIEPHTYSDLSQPTTGPGPTVAGTVYVTNYWGQQDTEHGPFTFGETTYALDGTTGATIRTYAAGNARAPVVAADGWLYLGDFDGFRVEAFGPQGEHFTVGTPAGPTDIITDGAAVRVSAGTAIFSFLPHGCGQPTCAPIRSDQLGPVFGTSDAPDIAENGDTIFAVGNNQLYAFARRGCGVATCRARWTYDDVWVSGAGIAVTDDAVYLVTGNGIRVLNAHGCGASSCTPIWSSNAVEANSSPVVANGLLLAGTVGGALQAWDAAGCGAATCASIWSSPQSGRDLSGRRRRRDLLPHAVAQRCRVAQARARGAPSDLIRRGRRP